MGDNQVQAAQSKHLTHLGDKATQDQVCRSVLASSGTVSNSPYRVLGVDDDDLQAAARAYRWLNLALHPDKSPCDAVRGDFELAHSLVMKAWDELKDEHSSMVRMAELKRIRKARKDKEEEKKDKEERVETNWTRVVFGVLVFTPMQRATKQIRIKVELWLRWESLAGPKVSLIAQQAFEARKVAARKDREILDKFYEAWGKLGSRVQRSSVISRAKEEAYALKKKKEELKKEAMQKEKLQTTFLKRVRDVANFIGLGKLVSGAKGEEGVAELVEGMADELEALKERLAAVKGQAERAREENVELRAQLKAKKLAAARANQQAEELQEQLDHTTQEAMRKDAELNNALKEISLCKKDFEDQGARAREEAGRIQSELNQALEKKSLLEDNFAKIQKEKEQIKEELERKKAELSKPLEEINLFKKDFEDQGACAREEAERNQSQLNQALEDSSLCKQKCEEMKKENERLQEVKGVVQG